MVSTSRWWDEGHRHLNRFTYAVARPKPSPDLFLHAARSEDAAPVTCLMIEDSAKGVRATVAAQIRGAAYGADANGDALAEASANTSFSKMADLPALILGTSP